MTSDLMWLRLWSRLGSQWELCARSLSPVGDSGLASFPVTALTARRPDPRQLQVNVAKCVLSPWSRVEGMLVFCCFLATVALLRLMAMWVVIFRLNLTTADHCALNDVTISEKNFYNCQLTPYLLTDYI